jgi:hypothetical protein
MTRKAVASTAGCSEGAYLAPFVPVSPPLADTVTSTSLTVWAKLCTERCTLSSMYFLMASVTCDAFAILFCLGQQGTCYWGITASFLPWMTNFTGAVGVTAETLTDSNREAGCTRRVTQDLPCARAVSGWDAGSCYRCAERCPDL